MLHALEGLSIDISSLLSDRGYSIIQSIRATRIECTHMYTNRLASPMLTYDWLLTRRCLSMLDHPQSVGQSRLLGEQSW